MGILHNRTIITGQPYTTMRLETAAQEFELGTLWAPNNDKFHRKFRYCKNGAVALAKAKLIQSAAQDTDYNNVDIGGAAAIDQKTVTVVTTVTSIATDLYKDGFFNVNDATGEGEVYSIASHTSGTTPVITLGEDLRVALASGSEFSLVHNPWAGMVITPTTTYTAAPAGVPLFAVTAAFYFWVQTGGVASILSATTLVVGESAGAQGTNVSGAVGVVDGSETPLGYVLDNNAATEYSTIFLTID
jgi:hypothetical protein